MALFRASKDAAVASIEGESAVEGRGVEVDHVGVLLRAVPDEPGRLVAIEVDGDADQPLAEHRLALDAARRARHGLQLRRPLPARRRAAGGGRTRCRAAAPRRRRRRAPAAPGRRRTRLERTRPPGPCYDGSVRVVVARCTVEYAGRLGARLPEATRLVILKADGSIAVPDVLQSYMGGLKVIKK